MIFNDSTINYIQLGMDVASLRQNVIASNIANIDTPNYKEKIVKFQNFLDSNQLPLEITNPNHINPQESLKDMVVVKSNSYLERNDKNNVNLTEQEAALAKNQILYNALAAFAKYKFGEYKNIISSSQGA
ncbi:flagellar basal-body rod protein FlgB [Desulfurella multipotens]|uniref:Flagellar basal body rod protein FlgB n=1 Tax=Desulfurella multipotens TaxID=79269 RepID=A0A1G6HTF0_9BACT|nr:flagellar basal body rod protein FlgB [Desulfurella multipotens]SDB97512.1 flagellar basal-body rod protein FlgB [Desulfurella multipotens]